MDITSYKEQAVAAGWLPKHIDQLSLSQLKTLLSAKKYKEYKFDYLVDHSNRATLRKFAVDNYGLNPEISKKLNIQQLKEFIRNESLYMGENLTYGPTVEGPYYPGERAVSAINRYDISPNLYQSSFDLTRSDLEAINKKVGGAPDARLEIKPETP
jgi:hypothetical protein